MPCIINNPCTYSVGIPVTNNPPPINFCDTVILYPGLTKTGECVLPMLPSIKHRMYIDDCCACVMLCWFIDSFGTYKPMEFICPNEVSTILNQTNYTTCACSYGINAKNITKALNSETKTIITIYTKEITSDFNFVIDEFINSTHKILEYPINDPQSGEMERCQQMQITLVGNEFKRLDKPNGKFILSFEVAFSATKKTVTPFL